MAFIQAKYFGPTFAPGEPRQIVIHSVESEIIDYLGEELAKGWFQNPDNQTSAHTISDPAVNTDMVNEIYRAWHCGNGNSTSLGDEHTGKAAFTTAQWTTPAGMKMLRLSAARTAKQCRDHNIRPRWLSLAQLANNEDGLCTHNDMRLVRGGTTHTDPGPGFPYALYLQMVNEELGNVPRDPDPNPTTPTEDDMPLNDADKKWLQDQMKVAAQNAIYTLLLNRETDYVENDPAKPVTYDLLAWQKRLLRLVAADYANKPPTPSEISSALRLALSDDSIINNWRNKFWDTQINQELPSKISFGEALRRAWKTVTGGAAAGSTTSGTSNEGSTGTLDSPKDVEPK